jgi:hypothetical protein
VQPHATRSRLTTGITALIIAAGASTLPAACSGSGSSSPAASSTVGALTSPAAGNANGSGSATCTQLTKDQVQPLLTDPITKASAQTVPDQVTLNGTAQQCTFAIKDSEQAIVVTVVGGPDADGFFDAAQQSLSQPVSVPGIGAKAVRDASDSTSTITAEDDGVGCSAAVGSEGEMPGVGALEEAAGDTSDIGDANFAVISTALGTLCNRVFGSGNTTPDFSGLTAATVTTPPDDGLPTDFSIPTDGAS